MDEYFERITAKEGAKKLSTITKVPVSNVKRACFELQKSLFRIAKQSVWKNSEYPLMLYSQHFNIVTFVY